ncbi:MAG: quinone-interacting membrane-bound oxidoreductase complex subunit QmoC [Thermodesulfobacteriota bacterium]
MANEIIVEPDLQFTKDLIKAGANDLKKCYQCATCSVACRISPDNSPYPRKEMIWAQWGLKDRLLNDPDVWLCHQCNDCSTLCPRGAYPADVLKAIRKMLIQKLSWPSFMGSLVGESSMAVLALGFPALVVLLLTYFSNGFNFSSPKPVHYGQFIGYIPIQIIYTLALIFAVVSMVFSLKNYWAMLDANNPGAGQGPRKGFVPSLIEALKEILPHSTFKDCEANYIRYIAHFLTFWGMIGLLVTTAIVAFNIDILHLAPPSRSGPGTIPIKILGNVSAIAFVVGLAIMLVRRIGNPEQAGNSSYFDWFFLWIIFGTGATGLITELSRWAGSASGAYFFYMVHLMFVLALLLYLPFSKFAHLGYRTIAIAWGKSVGRNMTVPVVPNFVPPVRAEEPEAAKEATV